MKHSEAEPGGQREVVTPGRGLRAIRNAKGLTSSEKLVLCIVLSHADRDGLAFPKHETIAEESGLSRGTVLSTMHRLAVLGLVTPVGKHRRANNSQPGVWEVVIELFAVEALETAAPLAKSKRGGARPRPEPKLSTVVCGDCKGPTVLRPLRSGTTPAGLVMMPRGTIQPWCKECKKWWPDPAWKKQFLADVAAGRIQARPTPTQPPPPLPQPVAMSGPTSPQQRPGRPPPLPPPPTPEEREEGGRRAQAIVDMLTAKHSRPAAVDDPGKVFFGLDDDPGYDDPTT